MGNSTHALGGAGCVVHAGSAAYGCRDCDRARKTKGVMPGDMPQGVAEFIGYAAMRGISLPIDFCQWLASSPRPLDCEQCIALFVCLRSTPRVTVEGPTKGQEK